jgi:hypothetical protein
VAFYSTPTAGGTFSFGALIASMGGRVTNVVIVGGS